MKQTEWQRVAAFINARMDAMVIDQAELERRSVSGPTVRALVTGVPRSKNPRKKTLQLVSGALGWTPDSIERIRAGGKPLMAAAGSVREAGRTPTGRSGDDEPSVDQRAELRALKEDMDELAKATVKSIRQMQDRIVKLDRRMAKVERLASGPTRTRRSSTVRQPSEAR